jgi:GT2 family glycosyltransferase/glycosyltransferase involved in cell wall biosynthesis
LDGTLASAPAAATRPGPRIEGYLERVEPGLVAGWAWMPEAPDEVVALDILLGGRAVLRVAADRFRADLLKAGRGSGRYGFQVQGLAALLESGRELLSVRLADGGADLAGSPRWLEAPAGAMDAAAARFIEAAIAGATRSATEPAALDAPIALLARLLAEAASARARLEGRGAAPLDQLAAQGEAAGPLAALAADLRDRFPPIAGLPAATAPRVSVVIPVHGRFDLTHACLSAIAAAAEATPAEILLVDDGSADETLLAGLVLGEAVRVIRLPRNQGFLHAANAGAAAARGEYILFLNNDTLPRPGFLDALAATLDADPGLGIAGARLLDADGTVQEAGGIVGRFGEALHWGRGEDPADPRFAFLRQADYVSGAALMIRRAVFERLGGFDAAYAPGYYEDTDLCFRVRHEAGLGVAVQPLAEVVHLEGATAGRDEAAGMKAHQPLNQRLFLRRWQGVLAAHRPAGEQPALEAERHVARRAIFVDECVPTPDRDAGSNAALGHMRLLQRLGHKVGFIAAADPAPRPGATDLLRRIGIECLHAPFARSVEEAFRRQPAPPDLVYLHRGEVAGRYLGLARHHFPAARVIYSVADLHFLRLGREAALAGDAALAAEAARMEAMELAAARAADAVIVHSEAEAAILAERLPGQRVLVLAWPVTARPPATPAAERQGVGFLGGYGHRPNVDAAQHLARRILPAVWAEAPELPCLLAGADMPAELRALAGPRLEALGHVPDLDRFYGRLRCTAAPLRYGAGIKGKVIESLARGIPCVMSPIAAEGIALPGELAWLVAADDATMAARILALHRDAARAEELGRLGLALIEAEYGEAALAGRLASLLEPAAMG